MNREQDQIRYVPEGYAPAQGYESQGDEGSDEELRNAISPRGQKRKAKSRANPIAGQPKSKRAKRREQIASEHGEVSAADKPKGLVEMREGVLWWFDADQSYWREAAYHDSYREQFILEDMSEGNYLVPPACGKGSDITTPCSAYNQLAWNLADRESWGNVVDADGNKVLYLVTRPAEQYYEEPPRLWFQDGFVLIDGDNHPVRPFSGIPRCFSSKLEGGRMEALKRILPMTIQDFRARMPRFGPNGKPLSFPSTFGHRAARWRSQYQVPAWLARAASAVLKQQILDQLPEGENATSTEGLRALSRIEIEQRKSTTRGIHLYKANGRAVSEEERRERDRKADEKLKRRLPEFSPRLQSLPVTPQRSSYSNISVPTPQQGPQSMPTTPWNSFSPGSSLDAPPPATGRKRRWEDDGLGDLGVEHFEVAKKRGRTGVSPLEPSPEDLLRQAVNPFDSSGTFQTMIPHQSHAELNEIGLGLDFGEGDFISSQDFGFHPEQPEATQTDVESSTDGSQDSNPQIDYRFEQPQNDQEQTRIQAALFSPRVHFKALMGSYPPYTSEGSYADQHYQILIVLSRNWGPQGELPLLADVGPWHGSFDNVPPPDLPDGVVDTILRLDAGSRPVTGASITGSDMQGSSHGSGAEIVEADAGSQTGGTYANEFNDWESDFLEVVSRKWT
ncbi:hypothetical protein BDR22DRAFT_885426 [Usnea florida]